MNKRILGRYIGLAGICFLLTWNMFGQNVAAKNLRIGITIKNSTVSNFNYLIIKDKKAIKSEVKYTILDESGNIAYTGITKNAMLWEEGIPFGKYKIIIHDDKDYIFHVTCNTKYVQEQHIQKKLILGSESSAKIGKNIGIVTLKCILGLLLLILLVLVLNRKRRRQYE